MVADSYTLAEIACAVIVLAATGLAVVLGINAADRVYAWVKGWMRRK